MRVERPHSPYFRYTGPGMLTAKAAASLAPAASRGPGQTIRRFLFGRRLSNEEEAFERLPKKLALPIFSSDAICSSAYATEEILRVLVVAGAGALLVSIQVAIAIVVLLTVVSLSYRQVCRAYPSGGGAYVVARENISPPGGARRGGRAAHRLRDDRRGLDRLGRRRRSTRSSRRSTTSGSRSRSSRSP